MPATGPKVATLNGHAPYRLMTEIVNLSVADSWREARGEWDLAYVYFAEPDAPGTCLCGHFPILQHCVLHNQKNGNIAVVGNICVQKFLGLPADELFGAFRRIMKNRGAALNAAAVEHGHAKGWITAWERNFSLDTIGRRRLTTTQRAKRTEINEKVVYWLQRVAELEAER